MSKSKNFEKMVPSEDDLLYLDLELTSASNNHSTNKSKKVKSSGHGWMGFVKNKSGNFAGSILNKLVSAGMQTPIVKYLLNPNTLKKALNKDPILRETYRIIWKSDPVQNLLTPEAVKIMIDTQLAKELITPDLVLQVLNHPVVTRFMTQEFFKFLLESEPVLNVTEPSAVLKYWESEAAKKFLRPEIMHEIAYSVFFTRLMDPEFFEGFLKSSGVQAVMTKEAIKDALNCPGAKRTMNQPEVVDQVLGVEGVRNLLTHEGFRTHLGMVFGKVSEMRGEE